MKDKIFVLVFGTIFFGGSSFLVGLEFGYLWGILTLFLQIVFTYVGYHLLAAGREN